jgi:putative toxin-antitoxin system protein
LYVIKKIILGIGGVKMIYTKEISAEMQKEFSKIAFENGKSENEFILELIREQIEDYEDVIVLDKAIEESTGDFVSLDDVIRELGLENELL